LFLAGSRMADISNSPDVDQVLASIRRLVGEGGGAARRKRLVLTPALRVPPEPGEDAPEPSSRGQAVLGSSGPPAEPEGGTARPGARMATLVLEETALLEKRIAELEAVVASHDAGWDEEEDGRWAGEAARPAASGTRPDPAAAGAVEDRQLRFGADLPADDARLRAMVAEIIEEELKGALGERITRTVRKLVHREIKRVLAARDLE